MENETTTQGASNNERLLAAARSDNEDLLVEIFEEGNFDINCQDGLGNTPLHNAVMHGSTEVLEYILSHEECDVDPVNRIDKATPLHLAVQIPHTELRLHIIDSLLDAGADMTIQDKNGETFIDLVPEGDAQLRDLIRKHQVQATVQREEVVASDDEDAGPGSGSDED